jgi:hypothetical protein
MQKNTKSNLDHALYYLEQKLSVIPIGQDSNGGWKKPLIKWEHYQKEHATEADLITWWKRWPDARIGIVTGIISGIVVVDIDPRHGGKVEGAKFPSTLTSLTGGGGWHFFYKHPMNQIIPNTTSFPEKGLDIRGDGGFVVVPPSLHASGVEYAWSESFDMQLITHCPPWVINCVQEKNKNITQSTRNWKCISSGATEGQRNTSATSLIGKLLHSFDAHVVWDLVSAWNACLNKPPLPEKELSDTFLSILKREYQKRMHKKPKK